MHPILGLKMGWVHHHLFMMVVQSWIGRDAHPVFLSYKNDMASLPKSLIYGQHSIMTKINYLFWVINVKKILNNINFIYNEYKKDVTT